MGLCHCLGRCAAVPVGIACAPNYSCALLLDCTAVTHIVQSVHRDSQISASRALSSTPQISCNGVLTRQQGAVSTARSQTARAASLMQKSVIGAWMVSAVCVDLRCGRPFGCFNRLDASSIQTGKLPGCLPAYLCFPCWCSLSVGSVPPVFARPQVFGSTQLPRHVPAAPSQTVSGKCSSRGEGMQC